ncbi:MAG TPA: type II toxin-antitoxin system Phd/YefM family antitoxin [Trebonia sp.]|jgi:prevent-host-death family protein
MTTVPLAEARQNFSALVDQAVATHQRVQVTRNGLPVIWMISDDDFESIMETLDVLADQAAMRDIAQSEADLDAGRYFTAQETEKILRARTAGVELGSDAEVIADMHGRGLPDAVCMATLDALIAIHQAGPGDLPDQASPGRTPLASVDAREGRDRLLGVHPRPAGRESSSRWQAAA